MKLGFCLIFLLSSTSLTSQSFVINTGYDFMYSKTKVAIVTQQRTLSNHNFIGLNLDNVWSFKKLAFSVSYEFFNGWTNMRLTDETNFFGAGSSSTFIHRFGLIAAYDLLPKVNRLSINPYLGLTFDHSQKTSEDYTYRGSFSPEQAPDFVGDRYLEIIGRNQVIPSLGLNIKWSPFWRIVLKVDYHFTYGYRPFQRMYYFYEYKGVPQPTAEWYSDGTAHFLSVGFGIRLGKDKRRF